MDEIWICPLFLHSTVREKEGNKRASGVLFKRALFLRKR
jgi:hypothetical protein